MDCSTWFLIVFKPKTTYPLPLGFQHTQFCGAVFLRYSDGIAVGWCCFFMLEFQEFACRFCLVFLAGGWGRLGMLTMKQAVCRSGLDALSGSTWGKENGCSVPENGQILCVPSRAGTGFDLVNYIFTCCIRFKL